eukprot:1393505-Amorphochlora_amoeboformis.AAC.1
MSPLKAKADMDAAAGATTAAAIGGTEVASAVGNAERGEGEDTAGEGGEEAEGGEGREVGKNLENIVPRMLMERHRVAGVVPVRGVGDECVSASWNHHRV